MNFTGSILESPDVACPVDLHYLSPNQPSLCIPRVSNKVNETFIRSVLNNADLGMISHIEIIDAQFGKKVFVYFEKWYWNQDAQKARKALITGNDIKIIHNNPWFWNVSAKRLSQHTSENPRPTPSMNATQYKKRDITRPDTTRLDNRVNVKRTASPQKRSFNIAKTLYDMSLRDRSVPSPVPVSPPVPPAPVSSPLPPAPVSPLLEDQGIDIDYSSISPPPPPKLIRQNAKYSHKEDKDPLYEDI